MKRVRVTRLVAQLPQALEELKTGAIHLTGLFLLSQHLTAENADSLLAEARGKSRREIEVIIARWAPRPDVPDRIEASLSFTPEVTCPGTGNRQPAVPAPAAEERPRLEPLSATRYRVEFTASSELRQKIQRAEELLSHALPRGDLAALFERAIDELIERETRKRVGARGRRKRRASSPDSRHVPVEVAGVVRERDGHQCTFVDAEGHRCTERNYLTLEHRQPFAHGGDPTPENLELLCAAHNQHTARKVFGAEHIAKMREDRERTRAIEEKVLKALIQSGFREREAKRALREPGCAGAPDVETMLSAALRVLVPSARRHEARSDGPGVIAEERGGVIR